MKLKAPLIDIEHITPVRQVAASLKYDTLSPISYYLLMIMSPTDSVILVRCNFFIHLRTIGAVCLLSVKYAINIATVVVKQF